MLASGGQAPFTYPLSSDQHGELYLKHVKIQIDQSIFAMFCIHSFLPVTLTASITK
jgi:hypothetical protein